MAYPDNCIRGVLNDTFLVPGEEKAAPHLFYFDDAPERDDGWKERSINWQDDGQAIDFTLNQRREDDGEILFRTGVAVLPRARIDWLIRVQNVVGILGYERQKLPTNRYHGNILLRKDTSTTVMRMIGGTLALFSEIVRR